VESASALLGVPFTTMNIFSGFTRPDLPEPAPGEGPSANYRVFDADALAVLGIRTLQGRAFTDADRWATEPVAMINEAAAREYWPGENPIGKMLDLQVSVGYPDTVPRRIVGVTANFRRSVTEQPEPEMYVPYEQVGADFPQIALRYRGTDAAAVLAAAQREVQALDAALPVARPSSLDALVKEDMAAPTFYLLLLSVFAVLAVGLAAVGLYGVVAYLASRRTREIGIRIALGARVEEIVRLTVWQGARPALLGAAVGLAGALALGRYVRSILYEVAPSDPLAIMATVVLLIAVVLLATAVPALRAARIPPSQALRA
jgi:predicted permease